MVLTCTKCDARLRLDEAKLPSHQFSVRCPKCQASIDVKAPAETNGEAIPEALSTATPGPFDRPDVAPRFNSPTVSSDAIDINPGAVPGMDDLAELLAQALRRSDGAVGSSRPGRRPAWDKRKALVCASAAYREVIAQGLADNDYDVFVAENMAQGLGRMREERMDLVILDANFDPLEQGVAFITREVKLLRPSERRRLFVVYLTSGVRTMDPHAAFLNNVNLVVNPSDIEQLPEALDISIRHYNELYRDFNRALDVAPI
jgi:predicted Zn finger-like uncharacterized protein